MTSSRTRTGRRKGERPNWDAYFMEIAGIVAKRSTCLRRNVGALIVKDKRILATGYNGAPSGLAHCGDLGCLRELKHVASGERHELSRVFTRSKTPSYKRPITAFPSKGRCSTPPTCLVPYV